MNNKSAQESLTRGFDEMVGCLIGEYQMDTLDKRQ